MLLLNETYSTARFIRYKLIYLTVGLDVEQVITPSYNPQLVSATQKPVVQMRQMATEEPQVVPDIDDSWLEQSYVDYHPQSDDEGIIRKAD